MDQHRSRSSGLLAFVLLAVFATQSAAQAQPSKPSLATPLSATAFIQAVLADNAGLTASRLAALAAETRIAPAGALEDPMLSLSAAPRTLGSSMGVGGSVEVSQPLPWWGTRAAREAIARAEADAANDDLSALRLSLAALARGAFADWVYIRRALDINASNQAVLAELRNTARIRYAAGEAPQEDVLQADVTRAMLKDQQLELERESSTIQAHMNALLDRVPQTPLPPPADLPAPATLPAEELLAQRAVQHPELQMLQARENAATAQERLAEKDRFPKFDVSAGYNSMWADPVMRPMLGISFSIPIDQAKYRGEIAAARADARHAASTLEEARTSLLADVAAAYASVVQSAASIKLYRDELLPLSQSTLEVARAEYASGRGDFLNVLTAEQHRLDIELGLARLQSQYFEQLADLERLSAGALPSQPAEEGLP